MTEDLGTPTRPHALTGEQWRLDVRTDDPPSPSADERWIRSDIDGGDRVATIKCGDGTEIPLFPTGTAEETVREARRYRVGGQTVYAPLAPVDEAAFAARRVQHDGQTHAFHDRVGPGSAIPDSVVAQFDFREEDGSLPVTDQSGNGNDLTNGSYSGVGRTINGNQAGDFDGNDDRVFESSDTTYTERNVIIAVVQADVTATSDYFLDSTSTGRHLLGQQKDGDWFINQGSTIRGSAVDTNPHLVTGVFDATDDLRVDGTSVASGDAGSGDLTGFNLGSVGGGGNHWDGAIGFAEFHDGPVDVGLSSREQDIADEWGISLS